MKILTKADISADSWLNAAIMKKKISKKSKTKFVFLLYVPLTVFISLSLLFSIFLFAVQKRFSFFSEKTSTKLPNSNSVFGNLVKFTFFKSTENDHTRTSTGK